MGIANPVTRETCGSGTQYHMQLARQLAGILQAPLEVKKTKWAFYIVSNYFHIIRNLSISTTLFIMWFLFNQHAVFFFQEYLVQCTYYWILCQFSKLFSLTISDISNFLNVFDMKLFSSYFQKEICYLYVFR